MPAGIWNGTLSFGLVAVPVRMVSATRDLDVRFHQVDGETGERIQIRRICETDGEEIPWEDIGRGYDLDGQLVTLTDEELEAAAPERTHTIEIEEFVNLDEIDPAQFDHPYYLVPSSESEGTTRAYRLLRDAMASTNQAAIGRVVLRSNEYLVAVREHDELLALSTMLFADELRSSDEIDAVPTGATGEPKRGEVAQAAKLIEAMTRNFDAAGYEDHYRERLLGLVESKRKSKRAKKLPQIEAPAELEAAPDLMAALKQSLERVRSDQ
ncbi:MAG TPA: Ku protein [Solirubrobacteraceae bacterium]|jgi:DNA end-binding protein Ku|nr:Ku protein [Solirubrobacteraceae bacterium]